MDGLAPPEAERRLWRKALRKLQLLAAYHAAALLARVVARPFWFFEQRRGRLADELERRRT
jgi:hypothetical protein